MCAILDPSKFGKFTGSSEEGDLFRNWLEDDGGSIVYPNDEDLGQMRPEIVREMRKLIYEFTRDHKLLRMLKNYYEQGKVRRIGLSEVAQEYSGIKANIRSNDRHILALALASGARLLYTADKPLARDFANPNVIGNPAGEVYMSATDQGRLRPDICKNC